MLLRTRISLFASAALVLICAFLAFTAAQREKVINARFGSELVIDRGTVWQRIVEKLVQQMEQAADTALSHEGLITALANADQLAIQQQGGALVAELVEAGIIDRLDILWPDSDLAFTSQQGVFASPIISNPDSIERIRAGDVIGGLSNDRERNIAVVAAFPLYGDDRLVGIAAYATAIDQVIAEMEKATLSRVFLVNRRGRVLAPSDGTGLWRDIGGEVDLLGPDSLQTVSIDDQVYSVIALPQQANLGSLRASLISVKNVTASSERQRRLLNLMIGGTIAGLLLVVAILNIYLARAFTPLGKGINMLRDLSRGRLDARMDDAIAASDDEVGSIARALNAFRTQLIATDRLRLSRGRQRDRQERLIRREMTQLADTLDDSEREAVLQELESIERKVEDGGSRIGADSFAQAAASLEGAHAMNGRNESTQADRDGLAMLALAFHSMSDRVRRQNQDLRDALKTKNALVAIQRELDIAARVQISLVPDQQPPSTAYEIYGTMKPAKEVGGDFFDIFRLSDNRLALVIADVSGKGVPAALFMVMARTVIRATAQPNESPGRTLQRVNSFLERNNAEDLFVTVFYGVLNEDDGSFTYANGGHTSPLYVHRRQAQPLPLTGGVVLGMIGGLEFRDHTVTLEASSKLILVTDGVDEAEDMVHHAYGMERLIRVAETLPEQSSALDVQAIVTDVAKFVGDANQFDDLTCVVVHRLATPSATAN